MLDSLFKPSSIAVIGASNNPVKAGGRTVKALLDAGYDGEIYPVNPKPGQIMGLDSYPNIREVPGKVDLAILNVPARFTLDTITDCSAKGARFAIIHAAGFGEVSSEGKEIESRVVSIARDGGTRVIGPNCMGIYSPAAGIDMIVSHFGVENLKNQKGPVTFFGQSGWASETFIVEGFTRGLKFNKVISIGNQCDLTIPECIQYFKEDPETRVIAGYMEGMSDGNGFLKAAGGGAGDKPIIIWKAGRTSAGARAAASHTGSLAVADKVCDAAFRQSGIIRAENLQEMLDFTTAFATPYLPKGKRTGILVEAGGGAVAAADACEDHGLEVTPLSETAQNDLREFIKKLGAPIPSTKNPVDVVWPPPDVYDPILSRSMEVLFDECDAVFWITYSPLSKEAYAGTVAEMMHKAKKPIFMVPTYPTVMGSSLAEYTEKGIPAFPSSERAIKALSMLVKFAAR